MIIFKKFEFEMAHCLDGHNRGCNNVHGHSYKLEVGYKVDPVELIDSGSSEGMGIDFNDLKKVVNKEIIDQADHHFIYNRNNKNEVKIANQLEKIGKKTLSFNVRTTCENMALYMLQKLREIDAHFEVVRLWETSGSYVEVNGEDIVDMEMRYYENIRW